MMMMMIKSPGVSLTFQCFASQVFLPRQLTVVQQFKIDWGEPFASILVALEVRS
jgi:hypothetical protein